LEDINYELKKRANLTANNSHSPQPTTTYEEIEISFFLNGNFFFGF
jgi:hypothetical protein